MELRWEKFGSVEEYDGYLGVTQVFNITKESAYSKLYKLYTMSDYYLSDGEYRYKGTLEECKAEALRLLTTSA